MAGFHDVRLPDDIERGAQGGPRFKTEVIPLSSGFEKRNITWSQTRGGWDVGYGLRHKAAVGPDPGFAALLDFFYARFGMAFGFRFKDWTDFELARQSIGLTDTVNPTFQIFKRYTSGGEVFDRQLKKIVLNSESVWVNSVSIAEGAGASQYQLDDTTGIITLGSTLAAQSATAVEVLCEFDVAVRFASDALDLVADTDVAATLPNIPIIEIRT